MLGSSLWLLQVHFTSRIRQRRPPPYKKTIPSTAIASALILRRHSGSILSVFTINAYHSDSFANIGDSYLQCSVLVCKIQHGSETDGWLILRSAKALHIQIQDRPNAIDSLSLRATFLTHSTTCDAKQWSLLRESVHAARCFAQGHMSLLLTILIHRSDSLLQVL